MQNSTNMRILELLRFLYERTDENHPATVSDIIAYLNGKGIQAVRQTVYADTNTLIEAGIDIVVVKSIQNQTIKHATGGFGKFDASYIADHLVCRNGSKSNASGNYAEDL